MFEDAVIPLDVWVSRFVEWLVDNYRDFFQALKWPVETTLNGFDAGLNWLSPIVVIGVIALVAWRFSGKGLAIFSAVTLTFVGLLGLWSETMTTLAMVLSSVVFCTIVGIPAGIWSGRSNRVERSLRPVLDAMQTTPAFVYLVPIVMLFSRGQCGRCSGHHHFCPAAHYPPDQPGHSSGASRTGGGCRGIWRHPPAGPAPGSDTAGPADDTGRVEPDHHDGPVHGGHRRPYWGRRPGFTGDTGA